MKFTISDGDGAEVRPVLSCQDCTYASTKNHFRDGPVCPLCHSEELEKVDTVRVK